MPNPSQTENWIVATLRDVPTPAPPVGLTTQMIRARSRRRFGPWLAASGVASMTVLLIVAETLQPTTTLADVARAQSQQTEYTVATTHVLNGGRQIKGFIYRDGSKWKMASSDGTGSGGFAESMVMDGQRTVTLWHFPPSSDFAEVDEARPFVNTVLFDLHEILRGQGKDAKPVAVKWHGKSADRFEVHTTYRDSGRIQTYDQTVIADPKSHLPLRVEIYRDNRSWGDIWEYTYSRPSESLFKTVIPPLMKTYDLPKQRLELEKGLTKGEVLINHQGTIELLLPDTGPKFHPPIKAAVEENGERVEGMVHMEVMGLRELKIAGNTWSVGTLVTDQQKPIEGDWATVEVGNQHLSDLPVLHISEEHSLLRKYTKAFLKLGG